MTPSAAAYLAKGPAANVWHQALKQIPTVFGRLVFLAGLRDPDSGHYQHAALASMLGAEEADRVLCHSHHQVFSEWLAFGLADQESDLDEYIRSNGGVRSLLGYRNLPPRTAREVERQLYVSDLETLLELLRYDRGAVSPPVTSPPR